MKNESSYSSKDLLAWGRETLDIEAQAISASSERLNATFIEAVETIIQCKGKLATTGLGKSGHIARKISSTFSSTGTPSFFLHPGEALHGDFGMISKEDCLLAIAYGGETAEVIEVVNFARRLGVKIIAITGKPGSSLAKAAHYVVDGSIEKEACPLGLAPTSSSSVALAMGDALAISVMRAKGFGKHGFASLHPGGSLGRKLSLVRDHMRGRDQLRLISEHASFSVILESITNPNFGIVGIVDAKENLVGAITDGDIRRGLLNYGNAVINKLAKDLMGKSPKVISEESLSVDAVRVMEDAKITSLFVVGSGQLVRPVGLIRMHDLYDAKIV